MPKPTHVLVIDDDSMIRLLISKALQDEQWQVMVADSGEAGLKHFTEKNYDVVLLDVMMPNGMDGFATCTALRKLPNGALIPIVMMTGLEDIESINLAFELGATDFITKPINFALLRHRVRYMLKASQMTQTLAQSEQHLHRLAYYDSLTELPNRQFFYEHLQQMIALAERQRNKLAVLFLDLDGFKHINDTLGHRVGDLLIQASSLRLHKNIRSSDLVARNEGTQDDNFLARLGGDEFTLLLSVIERHEDAAIVAERIRASLAEPFVIAGQELFISASIGIAIYPENGNTGDVLLQSADLAMYQAKRDGGNNYCYFSSSMTTIAQRRLQTENHLRKAIEQGELELYYQPQLDIKTGRYEAVETLLRWHSQELGSISPAEFIPLAEESNLIIYIGEWVLREACRQFVSWQKEGIPIARIAVNVSAVQFLHKDFPTLVAEVIAETGIAPSALELELTETSLISDANSITTVLASLKELGIELAIDDFGTGYSSLSRLKDFPIDRLKIDQSFVKDLEVNEGNAAIAIAIIAMAKSMRMKVIAEGVENKAQQTFLEQNHCDELQGYLLSRPLPAKQLKAFLVNDPLS